jgi:hypothetical protein
MEQLNLTPKNQTLALAESIKLFSVSFESQAQGETITVLRVSEVKQIPLAG